MANVNGHKELQALARIDTLPVSLLNTDPEVLLPATADLSALAVDWMGFNQLVQDPTYRPLLKDLPKPKTNDTPAEYIRRIWHLLSAKEQGTALEMGLQKMVTMQRVAETGIQVRIWRAYQSGEWMYSPECHNDFRPWVRSIMVDTLEGSAPEASRLANVCEAVAWLQYNNVDGVDLPDDLETCFQRPFYRRWKAVAGKILLYAKSQEEPEGFGVNPNIGAEIAELVEAVYDTDKTTDEVDQAGRKKNPQMQPLLFEEHKREAQTGEHFISAQLTDNQLLFFQRKLGNALDLRLEGESYKTEDHQLVEYRLYQDSTAKRVWVDNDWSAWEPSDMDVRESYFDSVHADPELVVTYLRYWEKVNVED